MSHSFGQRANKSTSKWRQVYFVSVTKNIIQNKKSMYCHIISNYAVLDIVYSKFVLNLAGQ